MALQAGKVIASASSRRGCPSSAARRPVAALPFRLLALVVLVIFTFALVQSFGGAFFSSTWTSESFSAPGGFNLVLPHARGGLPFFPFRRSKARITVPPGQNCTWGGSGDAFSVVTTPDSFAVVSIEGGSAPVLLFAKLIGPRDQHYGCYLRPRTLIDNAYSCPDLPLLDKGTWNVTVLLVRVQCAAVPAPQTILDFMVENELPDFIALRRYLDYPWKQLLDFKWKKKTKGAQPSAQLCSSGTDPNPPGRWVRYKDICASRPDLPFCPDIYEKNIFIDTGWAVSKGLHHMFLPFTCSYRYFDDDEARFCLLNKTRLLIAGDSRVRQYRAHIDAWLGAGTADTVDLNAPHIHFGFEQFFRSNQSTRLYDALLQGRTVIFNNLLHDIVDLVPYVPTPTVREYLGLDACGTCVGTVESCDCGRKSFPYAKWESWLPRLGLLVEQGIRRGGGKGKVYWISLHKRQPIQDYAMIRGALYLLHDMVWLAEDRAAVMMEKYGVEHMDVRHHVLTAPRAWWDDHVHYGNTPHSLLQHISTQILLNQLCD